MGVIKCLLFGNSFVLNDASLDFVSVYCTERRGGHFSQVTLHANNSCFFLLVLKRLSDSESLLREGPLYVFLFLTFCIAFSKFCKAFNLHFHQKRLEKLI